MDTRKKIAAGGIYALVASVLGGLTYLGASLPNQNGADPIPNEKEIRQTALWNGIAWPYVWSRYGVQQLWSLGRSIFQLSDLRAEDIILRSTPKQPKKR